VRVERGSMSAADKGTGGLTRRRSGVDEPVSGPDPFLPEPTAAKTVSLVSTWTSPTGYPYSSTRRRTL
jgi:hypothetical protein